MTLPLTTDNKNDGDYKNDHVHSKNQGQEHQLTNSDYT